jgi:hypothetical protein
MNNLKKKSLVLLALYFFGGKNIFPMLNSEECLQETETHETREDLINALKGVINASEKIKNAAIAYERLRTTDTELLSANTEAYNALCYATKGIRCLRRIFYIKFGPDANNKVNDILISKNINFEKILENVYSSLNESSKIYKSVIFYNNKLNMIADNAVVKSLKVIADACDLLRLKFI